METHLRTVAKTLSWRFLATIVTSVLVWMLTGKLELGLSVGILDCLSKIIIYYVHERLWVHVSFGYCSEPVLQADQGIDRSSSMHETASVFQEVAT